MQNTSINEKKRIQNRACRWFSAYLKHSTAEISTEEARRQLIGSCLAVFRRTLRKDDSFFEAVSEFCAEKRQASEKNAFFDAVMGQLSPQIRREIKKRTEEVGKEEAQC